MPTREAETQFNVSIQERLKALVYTINVRTWYVNSVSGKNTLIWPGTGLVLVESMYILGAVVGLGAEALAA